MKLLALPLVGWMIVALRTLDLYAEKDPGYLCRDAFRFALLCQKQTGLSVTANIARGRNEIGGDLIPPGIAVDAFGDRSCEPFRDESQRPLICAAGQNNVAPVTAPMLTKP